MSSLFHRLFFVACAATLFLSVSWAQQDTVAFYLAPDGNDGNAGTRDNPFQSLDKAKDAVRTQLTKTPGKSVIVHIKGGVYRLESPVVFTAEDSGCKESPVVYQAIEGDRPIFTGGQELNNWQLASNPDILELLPPDAKGKI